MGCSARCQVSCASWQGERIVYIVSKHGHNPANGTDKPICTEPLEFRTNTESKTSARSVRDETRGYIGMSG